MGYTKEFVTALAFVWGEGFLSPGGPEEVEAIIGGQALKGARILDFGSGLGGIDMLLASAHGAGEVIGIDVVAELIDMARNLASRNGLADRVSFQLVTPGALPFPDASFDVVFSKDAMVHVPGKLALYHEFMRVLRPGGRLMASDWLWTENAADNAVIKSWNKDNPLGFVYTTPAEAQAALVQAGFHDVALRDRHREIADRNRREVTRLEGPDLAKLAALVGETLAQDRLRSARARQPVLDEGALLPTHLKGVKPRA